jgi:alpha-N-arabinofuranosidase
MIQKLMSQGDGGIHGQLLKNNGFQGTSPGLTAYAAVGGTTLTQDTSNPLTSAITSSLKVSVPSGTTGQVGFSNAGYSGVPVNADTYQSYFWMKGVYTGTVTLQLVGASSGIVYASQEITVASVASKFTYFDTTFTSTQSPDGNNNWQLTFDGATVAGGSLWFSLVQLFPATYHERSVLPIPGNFLARASNEKSRFNGIRKDVGEFLENMGASFLRFPGGNNLYVFRISFPIEHG